ncbi:MAG: NTP transferase domain-containing protein [Spirochaetes bacterium]|nr:NTP transferase domain-containing protein [Spirochaetota bacterium]
MQAIILAGGKGQRLKPFTYTLPKPLMPIGETPILEIILKQLKQYGIKNVVLSINHLAEIIMAFFGDGRKLGMDIRYSEEKKALGTAGPMSLVKDWLEEDFIVMNGDLLTSIDIKKMFWYHKKNKAIATIGTYRREVNIDFGVLDIKNNTLKNYIEKPKFHYDVSVGINIFNKRCLAYLKHNERLDIPELIMKIKKDGQSVHCFDCNPYYWLDIGRVDDYNIANEFFLKHKKEFLSG